eukprot:COSAG02_NODE_209_length_28965_cov_18.680143_30_plen_134_part_00
MSPRESDGGRGSAARRENTSAREHVDGTGSSLTVLPEPLEPTIRVRGFRKAMTCGSSGEKLRIPAICSLLIVLMLNACPRPSSPAQTAGQPCAGWRNEATSQALGPALVRTLAAPAPARGVHWLARQGQGGAA